MGTSVSNLQFLGVPEEAVRAALPKVLVGRWSERFVTACPDMAFRSLERKASFLSRKLACTLLSVSMFDGDTVSLVLFREGKRLTRHVFDLETGESVVGNPKAFCAGLGLPEELAPKLKRLFAVCPSQEEKLSILQALLGAPLFIRYGAEEDGYLPREPVKADSGPLEEWAREHPEPPKIKNQCKAELIQEIPDLDLYSEPGYNTTIFRNIQHADEEQAEIFGCKVGDVVGTYCSGGYWARLLPDGRLELTPLADPDPADMYAVFHKQPPNPEYLSADYGYTRLGDRLVTVDHLYQKTEFGQQREQTVVVHDTAGILPCPLPLTLEDGPAAGKLILLPDGGFLTEVSPQFDSSCPPVQIQEPALVCYGPNGVQRWTIWGIDYVLQASEKRIYAITPERGDEPEHLLALDMDGSVIAECPIPFSPYSTRAFIMNGIPYMLEPLNYRKDALLHRLTPDLRPDGKVLVPYMSSLALSPDGGLLYAAGYESSLRVIDARSLDILRDLPKKASFWGTTVDSQNRLWVHSGAYVECYTPELELISRHRLKGDGCSLYWNKAGQMCAMAFQRKTYTIRVYRFS